MFRKPLTALSQQVLLRRTALPVALKKNLSQVAIKRPVSLFHKTGEGVSSISSLYQQRMQSSLATAADTLREGKQRMSVDDDGYHLALNRNPKQLKKVLLISTSVNSLTNAVHMHLQETSKYELDVASVSCSKDIQEAVDRIKPDLVLCPFLTKKIPLEVYRNYLCWIVHPGIVGDRGAYSLDYALTDFEEGKSERGRWGVTVLQAHEDFDAGAIWSTEEFPMRSTTKSELYHTNVTRAAINAIDRAFRCFKNPEYMPISLVKYPDARGHEQTPLLQKHRRFFWESDSAKTIARKINAASGQPGIKVNIDGEDFFFYNAFAESSDLVNKHFSKEQKELFQPGQMVMKMNGAILFATKSPDEFLWVTQMKKKGSFKLPAELALGNVPALKSHVDSLPEYVPSSPEDLSKTSWKEIHYEVDNTSGVAYLHFDFCNGAMSTEQAIRLKTVYDYLSKERSDVRAIVLMGGRDSFSNGIHLNVINNAADPTEESTKNIEAIDDVTKSVLNTTDKLVISFIRCGAGAGGVMLSLASDFVWCDSKAVLHPYYKHMGLYGSEYWTYSLPRRVGDVVAKQLTEECKPISAQQAQRIGVVDQLVEYTSSEGSTEVRQMVDALLCNFNWKPFLKNKADKFDYAEAERCRAHELEQMYHSFRSKQYQEARDSFVH